LKKMILFHWKFYLFFACCLFLVGAPSPMPTGASPPVPLEMLSLVPPTHLLSIPSPGGAQIKPNLFLKVQQELTRLLVLHKARTQAIPDSDLELAKAASLKTDLESNAHAQRLETRIHDEGLTSLDNLIRNQGDCGPDSLALARYQITHPNFDMTNWRSQREALSRYVKLPCFLFPLFVYVVSKEICWQIIL
jgi:hypothetical protein